MLSSLLLGAHHCICFEDLSSEAIKERIKIFKPDIVIYSKKVTKKINNELFSDKQKNKPLFLLNFDDNKKFSNSDFIVESKVYSKDSNLFTLFTSGSTGIPKAVVHNSFNYIQYAKFTTEYFFGIKKNSSIFAATDAGWINGHTYSFYGPLAIGATSVINENHINLSLPEKLVELLVQIKPDCFYTSVTILRFLKTVIPKSKNIFDYCSDYVSLDRVGSCGEPLAHSIGEWALDFFLPKKKTIVNTYFQTETGGILVAPREEDGIPTDLSSVGKPREELGLVLAGDFLTTQSLKEESISHNELIITKRWDGIFKEIICDKKSNYFTKQGFYRLNDVGYFDDLGFLYLGGRSDDVINVSGHRISSSEIESVCISIEGINEVCAVSIDDKLCGSRVALFCSVNCEEIDGQAVIKSKIINIIKNKLSNSHIPKIIYFFRNLPKTKSGKIMRRIMRDLATIRKIDNTKDYSTLANQEQFLISVKKFNKEIN